MLRIDTVRKNLNAFSLWMGDRLSILFGDDDVTIEELENEVLVEGRTTPFFLQQEIHRE